jgi:hypothetical protein
MDVELDAGSFKDFQTRYETLRQNHLDGVGGWAMSIFLREGMCGWILAWKHSDLDAGGKKAPRKNQAQMDVNGEAGNDRGALVGLIASMALSKLKRSIKGHGRKST